MKSEINIFIHRRDFRMEDNSALNKLISTYPNHPIMHIFIFNPIQIDATKNPYYGNNCVQFMIESLLAFKQLLNGALYFFEGTDMNVLQALITNYRVNAIAWNLDYTPFATTRDEFLLNWCTMKKVEAITAQDYSLFPMGTILTNNKKPYEVFTPFYVKCLKHSRDIATPLIKKEYKPFIAKNPSGTIKDITVYMKAHNLNLKVNGGRQNALLILQDVESGSYRNYDISKNFPYKDATTKLSAYIKFGCVSIREVYNSFKTTYGLRHGITRELFWREFYAHSTWHFPYVLSGKSFKPYKVKWSYKQEWYDSIIAAKTGIPIIDAAIRELKTTGYINNRLRMIIASFITKDLAMDWRVFERDLFAKYLVDYDPSTNCHSWQGMASVGISCDPYWRIMNPWRQMQQFDPDNKYILQWIPELANVDISNLRKQKNSLPNYPAPMVDHDIQVQKYLNKWR